MTNKEERVVTYDEFKDIKERMLVTDDQIEFMLKVFNREEGLHDMNLSMEWKGVSSCDLPAMKASFHTRVDRFANLYFSESLLNTESWRCVSSGRAKPENIVYFVESNYQLSTRLGVWEEDVIVPTTEEYILDLDEEKKLEWLDFIQGTYTGHLLRKKLFPCPKQYPGDPFYGWGYNRDKMFAFCEKLGDLREVIVC